MHIMYGTELHIAYGTKPELHFMALNLLVQVVMKSLGQRPTGEQPMQILFNFFLHNSSPPFFSCDNNFSRGGAAYGCEGGV